MHFCVADSRAEEDVSFTKLQYKRFMDMLSAMEGVGIRPEIRHCCNSGAAILYPEFALDMVRPGIITYGNAPSEELEGAISLRPMMSLHSMIAQVRTVPAGTDISYGRLYRTTHDTRVAVLPIGYADGLSRLLTGKASFYLQGHQVPVIGRICMDMCMIDLTDLPERQVPYYRRELGVVFQDFRLFENKTVYENVAFAMRVIGEPMRVIRRRVPTILGIVGLQDKYNRFPSELSGGEKQRVALARAMANNPRMIIADEPTAGLNRDDAAVVLGLLKKAKRDEDRKRAIIVVTDNPEVADQMEHCAELE